MTGSVTDGDDRVNAKDGLDDTASAIAAPAMAARTRRGMRRGIMVSSRLPSDWKINRIPAEPGLSEINLLLFCCFIKRILKI